MVKFVTLEKAEEWLSRKIEYGIKTVDIARHLRIPETSAYKIERVGYATESKIKKYEEALGKIIEKKNGVGNRQ